MKGVMYLGHHLQSRNTAVTEALLDNEPSASQRIANILAEHRNRMLDWHSVYMEKLMAIHGKRTGSTHSRSQEPWTEI